MNKIFSRNAEIRVFSNLGEKNLKYLSENSYLSIMFDFTFFSRNRSLNILLYLTEPFKKYGVHHNTSSSSFSLLLVMHKMTCLCFSV